MVALLMRAGSVGLEWYNTVDVRQDVMEKEDLIVWEPTDSRVRFTFKSNQVMAWGGQPSYGIWHYWAAFILIAGNFLIENRFDDLDSWHRKQFRTHS